MSVLTYSSPSDKPLVWLSELIKTPPFSPEARIEAGILLRRLQRGENIGMPHSRPMPTISPHSHELRISDEDSHWRVFYTIHAEAIVILGILNKDTRKTPKRTITVCKQRLSRFMEAIK